MVVEFATSMVLAIEVITDANAQISKYNFSSMGENNIQLFHSLGFSTLANKKTSATLKTSLFFFATGTKETKD
jgi:hypothetical protein